MMEEKESIPQGGRLPRGWVRITLESVSEINPKFSINSKLDDVEVSFVPMKCVEELTNKIDLSNTRKLLAVRKGYTYFTDGDLLFAKITPCMENGKIAIARNLKNGIGFGSTEFHVVRLPEEFPRKFFFYFLIREELRRDARRYMTGSAGQLRVPANFIKDLPIPLPPLPEQHRIVAKIEELFTKLDAGVKALNEIKTQLKRYRQAVLKSAFEGKLTEEWRKSQNRGLNGLTDDTDEEQKISISEIHQSAQISDSDNLPRRNEKRETAAELLERIKEERKKKLGKKYKELPPIDTSSLPPLPEGWVWARVEEIIEPVENVNPKMEPWKQFKYLDIASVDNKLQKISEPKVYYGVNAPSRARQLVKSGDILFSTVRTYLKNIAVVEKKYDGQIASTGFCVIRPSEPLNKKFFFYLVQNDEFLNPLSRIQRGTSYPAIRDSDVFAQIVCIPPLTEQHQIVSEIERRFSVADAIEKTVEQSLAQAERLRQSILKRAFEGMLVPQDPSDPPASELLERIKSEKAKMMDEKVSKRGLRRASEPAERLQERIKMVKEKNITAKNGKKRKGALNGK